MNFQMEGAAKVTSHCLVEKMKQEARKPGERGPANGWSFLDFWLPASFQSLDGHRIDLFSRATSHPNRMVRLRHWAREAGWKGGAELFGPRKTRKVAKKGTLSFATLRVFRGPGFRAVLPR